MKQKTAVFWFRRDLRLHDNHGLYQALNQEESVLPLFIFDTEILDRLTNKQDARVEFIHQQVLTLKKELEKSGSSIRVIHGKPAVVFNGLFNEFEITSVYTNKDYEPYARKRDREIETLLRSKGIGFNLYKDHVLFEEDEILNNSGKPYTVFTPYSRKWRMLYNGNQVITYASEELKGKFLKTGAFRVPSLNELGFEKSDIRFSSPEMPEEIIRNYAKTRDLPFLQGTSRLGVHLRFGTVSIRELTIKAAGWSEVFLNELIWRNFFSTVLWHFPHVVDRAFKPQDDRIQWSNNEKEFDLWCKGETGYPMVDAGMRELNSTGFMHNRVRMITAGFLTKHLLIDWRWGEAYFAEKLLDYELASNNGNWQWAAGTGCDAAPWFRIFNPETQQRKFDPKGEYILKWVPEYGTPGYATPVVEHKIARERALQVYQSALK
jgi:deoxyribodipyrimidine photo-lyase